MASTRESRQRSHAPDGGVGAGVGGKRVKTLLVGVGRAPGGGVGAGVGGKRVKTLLVGVGRAPGGGVGAGVGGKRVKNLLVVVLVVGWGVKTLEPGK